MSLKNKLAAAAALPMVLAGNAYAALPTEVSTALGDMKDDGVSAATLVIVAVIAVAAILFLRRAVR
ncbi:major capsid protein [Acidovorax sp. SDU_ACID1]|uniref:major capsid protein n=1 Tax=Acidovorax sp. SDU_ACID1 TaxID=3136632 RepID=UPI003872E3B9